MSDDFITTNIIETKSIFIVTRKKILYDWCADFEAFGKFSGLDELCITVQEMDEYDEFLIEDKRWALLKLWKQLKAIAESYGADDIYLSMMKPGKLYGEDVPNG